jgi:hypothetical protein
MSRNMNEAASKDTLAQWVSLALKKALTENNIQKGFLATGIWPLNDHALDNMLAPSLSFERPMYETGECSANSEGAQGSVQALMEGQGGGGGGSEEPYLQREDKGQGPLQYVGEQLDEEATN